MSSSTITKKSERVFRIKGKIVNLTLLFVATSIVALMIVVDGITVPTTNDTSSTVIANATNGANQTIGTESVDQSGDNVNDTTSNNSVTKRSSEHLIQPSILLDYYQVLMQHNRKSNLIKPKPSISYENAVGRSTTSSNKSLTVANFDNNTNNITSGSILASTSSSNNSTSMLLNVSNKINSLANKASMYNPRLLQNRNIVGKSLPANRSLSPAASLPTTSSSTGDSQIHRRFKAELEYFKSLGDPLQTNKKPRWAYPCNPHKAALSTNTTDQQTVTIGETKLIRRKRRSISRTSKGYTHMYGQLNRIYSYNGGSTKGGTIKGTNGNPKQRFKFLHATTLHPLGKLQPDLTSGNGVSLGGPIITSPSEKLNVSLSDFRQTKDQLLGILRALFTKAATTKGLSGDLKRKLVDEYFSVREDFERDMETFRLAWLPRGQNLAAPQQTFTQVQEAFGLAKDYLQYFAVGFEQAIIDQMEAGDTNLMEFMQVESSVLDLLCTMNGVIRLNSSHNNQLQKIKSMQQQQQQQQSPELLATITSGKTTSDSTSTTTTINDSYVKRSVMEAKQRKEKQRAHRYVRDYMIVRDYISLIEFIKKLVTETVNELIKREEAVLSGGSAIQNNISVIKQ